MPDAVHAVEIDNDEKQAVLPHLVCAAMPVIPGQAGRSYAAEPTTM